MKNSVSYQDCLYGFILIMTSGNPFFRSKLLLSSIFFILLFTLNFNKDYRFLKGLIKFYLFSALIFIIQYFQWNEFPISFAAGYFVKVGIGAVLFYKLRMNLSFVLWKVVVYFSLFAFPFYLWHFFVGYTFDIYSVMFYTFRPIHANEFVVRNSGFCWEPGVYQIYINIVLFLNLNYISKVKKWELIILFISLLTTYSTTGYLIFFIIIIIYFYSSKDRFRLKWKKLIPFISIFYILLFTFIYFNTDFLHKKINTQTAQVSSFDGSFSNNRFLTFLFDLKYIHMNPILGNGYNFEMRYTKEDKKHLKKFLDDRDTEYLGAANGLSDMASRFGLLYCFIFFILFYKRLNTFSKANRRSFLFLILLFLWSSPMINYPFFMALPLIFFYKEKITSLKKIS